MDERAELTRALAEEMPWYVSAAVRFQVAVAHQLGMPVSDVHALAAMLEAGPVGISRLAELMGTTASAVTRLVDRLERGGFVRREQHADDRRRIVVRVDPERVMEIARFYEPMDARWRGRVDRYSDDELRFLLDFLRQGREDAVAETAALRSAGRAHGSRRRHGAG